MRTLNAAEASSKLYNLIDETLSTHQAITITSERGNAVLLSEDHWRSVQETLFLLSAPSMRESIRKGLSEKLESLDTQADW